MFFGGEKKEMKVSKKTEYTLRLTSTFMEQKGKEKKKKKNIV